MRNVVVLLFMAILIGSFFGCAGSDSGGISSGTLPSAKTPTLSLSIAKTKLAPNKSTSIVLFAKDAYGRLANGDNVVFNSSNNATFSPSSGELKKGYFSTTYTANSKQGIDEITAVALNQVTIASISIVNTIASPSITIITASSKVSPGKKTTIAIYVSQDAKPSIGSSLSLTSSAGGEFTEQSGKTDDKGWFITTYTAPTGITGKDTISAFTLGTLSTATITIASDIPEAVKAKITLFPDAVFTEQATLVSIVVTDSNGNPANIKANLACDLSGKWAGNTSEALSANITNGFFQTDFTAGKEVGSATIYLNTFNGVIATATLSIEKPALQIQLSSADTEVKTNDKLPLSVFISDELLRPYSEKTILLTTSDGGQFLDNSDAVLSSGNTDSKGVFSFFYQAGNSTGTTVIRAYCEGSIATKTIKVW